MGVPVPKPIYKRRVPLNSIRNKFNNATRAKIHERDDYRCVICGWPATIIHHVMFKSQGGRGVVTNGATVCPRCHHNIHQHFELAQRLRRIYSERYGPDYYKDVYDD